MATARRPSALRRTAIADAVIEVLAAQGSRRLTHRAVDQHLGLPEGSTSSYFRTRASLISAAAHRLADVDRESLEQFMARLVASGDTLTAPELVDAVVNDWTSNQSAPRQLARLELQLELLRSPDLADALAEHRSSFMGMTQIFAKTLEAHIDESADSALIAAAVMALVDGLVLDRLLYPATALAPHQLTAAVGQLAEGFHNQAINRWRPIHRHRLS
ncbi:DNA-binding transcriptional regulator YbjK [Mycobacterium sp. MAA66]|uniref:TetR/AcrR family transcriptional regulator n=1 Tax=Mycobacterium sp. MAA66 TaxID=3156297 RepID=UPI003514405A